MSNDKVKRMDNHRIFRPEAVEAYCTRRAGEPWTARLRAEGSVIAALTLLAAVAMAAMYLGEVVKP